MFSLLFFAVINTHFLRGANTNTTIGATTSISCLNGQNITCHRGTYGCTADSTLLCRQPFSVSEWGEKETIYCGNISTHCMAGTRGCFNDSNKYCHNIGMVISIHCPHNGTRNCHVGALGCYDNSTVYCY